MKQIILLLLIVGLGLVYTVEQNEEQQGVDKSLLPVTTSGCSCDKESDDCGCCAHIKFDKLSIDDNACVNVTYLPDQYGVAISMTWNDKVIFNKTVSASNPPPICIGVPHVKLLEVCVRLYNISYDKEHFGGCIALEFELIGIKEDFPLGCFHKSHAKLKQDYNKVRKNVEQVKKNLNIIKEKTKEEIQKWDDLFSDTYYADLKKQVVQEIGSFRNYLSDALVHFGEFMKPAQENEDKSEKPATG